MSVLFTVEQPMEVKKLGHDPEICRNAAFVFDKPVNLKPGQYLELVDGLVFMIFNNFKIPISGKWDR